MCYIKLTHNGETFFTSKRKIDGGAIQWDWNEGFDIILESLKDEILIEFKVEDYCISKMIGWEKVTA